MQDGSGNRLNKFLVNRLWAKASPAAKEAMCEVNYLPLHKYHVWEYPDNRGTFSAMVNIVGTVAPVSLVYSSTSSKPQYKFLPWLKHGRFKYVQATEVCLQWSNVCACIVYIIILFYTFPSNHSPAVIDGQDGCMRFPTIRNADGSVSTFGWGSFAVMQDPSLYDYVDIAEARRIALDNHLQSNQVLTPDGKRTFWQVIYLKHPFHSKCGHHWCSCKKMSIKIVCMSDRCTLCLTYQITDALKDILTAEDEEGRTIRAALERGDKPIFAFRNVNWANNTVEKVMSLTTVYIPKTPFIPRFKVTFLGLYSDLGHDYLERVKEDWEERKQMENAYGEGGEEGKEDREDSTDQGAQESRNVRQRV